LLVEYRSVRASRKILSRPLKPGARNSFVWEDTSTGQRAIWLLQNGVFSGSTINLSTVPVGWHIAGAGDFNGDGFADLVWENTVIGERAIWLPFFEESRESLFSAGRLNPCELTDDANQDTEGIEEVT
jgi:hypothetical protein